MEFRGRRIMRNIHKNVLPDQAQFCVTCLRTDCKLYPFTQYSLGEAYELLTGNSLQQEVRFTSKFCTECAHRLTSCRKFRARSLQAYDALAELAQMHDVLTTDHIKSINNKYSSCLSYSDVTLTLIAPEHDSSATNQQDVKVEPKVEHIKSEAGEELSDDGDKDSGNPNDVDMENIEELHENVKDTMNRGNIDTAKPKTKRKPKIKKGYKTSAEVQEMMKLFHLNKLTIEEQLADIQNRKESSNYKNSVYKCDVCFKGFASQNTYETHLKMHSTEYGQFLCEICKVYTKSASALRLHCKESHSTTYNCVSCPFVTKQKCSAVSHARWHTGVKYKCELCPEEYDKKTSLLSHVRLSHPSDVACPFCGYCFVNQCGLRKHLEMKHRFDSAQEVTGPLCGECDIRFASEAAFQQHVLVSPKHNTDRLHRNQPSVKHKRRSSTKIVECEQCGLACNGYRIYYSHFARLHPRAAPAQSAPRTHLCELCGHAFPSRWTLRDHEQLHQNSTVFQCDICKSKYSRRYSLINHMKSHCKPPPVFECPICGKKFNNKGNTHRHIMSHSELRPFECPQCGQRFVTAADRRAHRRHAHRRQPWPGRRAERVRASRRRDDKEPARQLLKAETAKT